ncbi:MAG TPA: 3-phosphoglycerate dehydrogenase family protein [Clostridia bacterium]|nr:3-phosphoglycerate dehydrogenase family protein [Clostridia bacterium]
MYNILKLNEISPLINNILTDNYNQANECENPDGIILRSFKMHDYPIPSSLLAVARAGAGVNNIPLDKMTDAGVVVFNTPGANANAVKELVITDMLIANRKIAEAIDWTNKLDPQSDVAALVEKGKKAFIGPEIFAKTLGVIGLGAIGRMVANACIELGMSVIGYDPYLSDEAAKALNSNVKITADLNEVFKNSDYITVHVPLTDTTKYMINKDSIAIMKDNVRIINCARGELVNNVDIIAACEDGKVAKYVTDFPCGELLNKKNIIAVPHLGASTPEAEDNCAVMAANQLKDYLENGNIINSVNFPRLSVAKSNNDRLTIAYKNNDNMVSEITKQLADNIANIATANRGNIGYIIVDLKKSVAEKTLNEIQKLAGVLKIRVID